MRRGVLLRMLSNESPYASNDKSVNPTFIGAEVKSASPYFDLIPRIMHSGLVWIEEGDVQGTHR